MHKLIKLTLLLASAKLAIAQDIINIFPLESYDQNVSAWIKPSSSDYNQPLLSAKYQKERYAEYYQHYYASDKTAQTPWAGDFVSGKLIQSESSNILTQEAQSLTDFSNPSANPKKIAYGENYRPYNQAWFQQIARNMGLNDHVSLNYAPQKRAIVVANTLIRTLPTDDPLFYSSKIAGEGYPFDNLQEAALFIGMPLYVIKQSADKEWSLVVASDDEGWIKTADLAYVDDKFIQDWQKSATQGVVAVVKSQSLIDEQGIFRAMAYNGTSLPLVKSTPADYEVLIPVANLERQAQLHRVKISQNSAVRMPLALTPQNMSRVMQSLIGKPYGWGSMFFDYDCSALTKAIFTPFGIYLPRNSGQQSQAGRTVNLDQMTTAEREAYLLKNGHKFLTLVQMPGHILLYLGNYSNPNSDTHETVALSYQSVWGLRTRENNSRSVVGGTVILPLLAQYPEDKSLLSFYDQAAKPKFRLVYLDEFPESQQK